MDYRLIAANDAISRVQECFKADAADIYEWMELPPDSAMGDFALPCFKLSKTLRMPPPAIAKALAEHAGELPEALARVEAVGGYLNYFVNRKMYARDVLTDALNKGTRLGASDEGSGKTVVLDYSSINIAKRFHIGHLSSTMIGHSLYRIYEHLGYKCVGVNHLGDWGTQFGKMIAAYLRWGDREKVEEGGIEALTELYVRFHDEAEKDPSLEDEGRIWFKKIEEGDEKALEIFGWIKDITLKYAMGVYDMLGVSFDSYAGESFYNDKMDVVVKELGEKGLLKESDGAQIVDLEEYSMPPCLILKSDGATLYTTRDITAALYRKNTYDFYKSLYVTAYQQDLHFRQWMKVVELMGYEWVKDMEHVSYGMVSFEGQALATRKGHTVYLDELLKQSVEKARDIIEEKSPELENKDEVARKIGVGAVVFFDLFNSRIKDIDFWFERALNFDGETGPYVQYTHARCCSVLRKAGNLQVTAGNETCWESLSDDYAFNAVRLIDQFSSAVREACRRNEPSLLTRHTCEMAKAYNRFYFEQRILTQDPAETAARLALTRAAREVIRVGLYLIGIESPERM